MTVKASHSTPLLRVADVERSIRFYELLGFERIDDEGAPGCPLSWARIHCEGGAMMLSRADHPVDASSQAVLFYLYTSDLPSLREHLVASGVEVSPIRHPDYMPSGEIGLKDPDGYSVLLCHWTSADHERWLKRVEEKRQRRHHAATPND